MSTKPDLTGVRRFSLAELAERRNLGSQGKKPKKHGRFKHKKIKLIRVQKGRTTLVASVSITPELRYRAARDLGEGSFSKAVVSTLTKALAAFDKERENR